MAESDDHLDRLRATARLEAFVCAHRTAVPHRDRVFAHGGSDHGPGYNDDLHCIDRATGESLWCFGGRENNFDILSPVALDAERVYVGRNNGELYALRRTDGGTAWTFRHGAALALPCRQADAVLFADAEGWLRRLDPATGKVLSERRAGKDLAAPELVGERLWLSHLDGSISCLDPATLAPIWRRTLERPLTFPALVSGTTVVACLADGMMTALDAADGKTLWSTRTAHGTFLPPVAAPGTGWAATTDGVLSCFNLRSGSIQYNELVKGIRSLASRDGRLWADVAEGVIALQASTGAVQESLPVEGQPQHRLTVEAGQILTHRVQAHSRVLLSLRIPAPLAQPQPGWSCVIGAWGLT